MMFPLWQIPSTQSQRIKTSRIFLGVLVGVVFLPSLFVIVATLLNILIDFGYVLPAPGQTLFYLSAQTLPFGLVAILASTPFCFAARHTGHIGLLPMLVYALALFAILSSTLWIGQLISFSTGTALVLVLISMFFGLIQWLVIWFTCILPLRS